MKKKALLLSWLFPLLCGAQTTVLYSYDAAGNRIQQYIPQSRMTFRSSGAADGQQQSLQAVVLDDRQVSVSLREGSVRVEIPALRPDDECIVSVYAVGGQLLARETASSIQTAIDLSPYHNHLFLLRVTLNGESESWKITKK